MEDSLRSGADDPALRLVETVLWDGAACPRLPGHLDRLIRSAAMLGWPCDAAAAARALRGPPGQAARLRLVLAAEGRVEVTAAALPPPVTVWRIGVSAVPLVSSDPWLRVKSTRRATHDAARAALAPGLDEILFLNERDELAEGTITTVFFDRGQGLCTPPVACGALPGVLRAALLAQGCREEVLLAADLPRVRLWLGNALRGLCPAVIAR
ncbi:MAG: aminotransferase class IV family protein [Paracoccaceae bacterium]